MIYDFILSIMVLLVTLTIPQQLTYDAQKFDEYENVDISVLSTDLNVSNLNTITNDELITLVITEEYTSNVLENIIASNVKPVVVNQINQEPQYDFNQVPLSEDLVEALVDSCEKFNVPIPVALAVINIESNFNPTVTSSAGCYGLMQLHPKYFNINGTPAENIRDGLEYLGRNIDTYGDIYVALNVYNMGHPTGDTYYPNKVMTRAQYWSDITGAPIS